MRCLFVFILVLTKILSFEFNRLQQNYCFDKEFAELISKPLPNLYLNELKPIENINVTVIDKYPNINIKPFIIPGFFEVFPELDFLWPKWSLKNNKLTECKSDKDCPFPQACCHHPIIPTKKFCCTGGYKIRKLEPAYITQEVIANYKNLC